MRSILDSLKQFKDGLENFARGGDANDPDIIAFAYASAFTVAMVLVALGASLLLWWNSANILFAMPVFPRMGDCSALEAYLANPQIPPREGIDPAIVKLYIDPENNLDGEAMLAECRYNFALHQAYRELEAAMNNIPVQIDEMTVMSQSALIPYNYGHSLQSLLKILCFAVALLGSYPLWVLSRREPHNEAFNKFSFENILLTITLAFLSFYGIDLLYSTMSARAYNERLSYEVLGSFGSRRVFRLTFIVSGVLFIVYILALKQLLEKIQKDVRNEHGIIGLKRFVKDHSRFLDPNVVAIIGILTAILIAGIGIFPVDSQEFYLIGEVSTGWIHKICAFVSPLLMLCMISSFWYMAYPRDRMVDKVLRNLSFIGVNLLASAMMMFLTGNLVGVINVETVLSISLFPLILVVIIFFTHKGFVDKLKKLRVEETRKIQEQLDKLVAEGNLQAKQELEEQARQKEKAFEAEKDSRWIFYAIALLIGLGLGLLFPTKMTTVSVEFVILTVFALFLYALSKYLIEYSNERFSLENVRVERLANMAMGSPTDPNVPLPINGDSNNLNR